MNTYCPKAAQTDLYTAQILSRGIAQSLADVLLVEPADTVGEAIDTARHNDDLLSLVADGLAKLTELVDRARLLQNS